MQSTTNFNAQGQSQNSITGTTLNRILLALCVGVWLTFLLLYSTSMTLGVIAVLDFVGVFLAFVFPEITGLLQQPWFRHPLVTVVLSIIFTIGLMLSILQARGPVASPPAVSLVSVSYKVNNFTSYRVDLSTVSSSGISVKPDDGLQFYDLLVWAPEETRDYSIQAEIYIDGTNKLIGSTQRKLLQPGIVALGDVGIEGFQHGEYEQAWQVQDGWTDLLIALIAFRPDGEPTVLTRLIIHLDPEGVSWFNTLPILNFVSIVYRVNDGPAWVLDLRDTNETGVAARPGDRLTLEEIWYHANAKGVGTYSVYVEGYLGPDFNEETFEQTELDTVRPGTHELTDVTLLSWTVPDDRQTLALQLVRDDETTERTVMDRVIVPLGPQVNPGLVPSSEAVRWSLNRLVTYFDFEDTDDGWSRITTLEFAPDGTEKSRFPDDPSFPGSMVSEVTNDYALTGQSSLKVTTNVETAGDFKSFLRRQGTVTGNGITIYVLAPDLTNVSIDYIQLCIPSQGWICSSGIGLIAGEWTPLTIDLSESDDNGIPLYRQQLTDLAVQWRFNSRVATSLELYFDSGEIFHPGS